MIPDAVILLVVMLVAVPLAVCLTNTLSRPHGDMVEEILEEDHD